MQELRKRRREEKEALQQVECLLDFEREFVKAEQKEKKHREDLERATEKYERLRKKAEAAESAAEAKEELDKLLAAFDDIALEASRAKIAYERQTRIRRMVEGMEASLTQRDAYGIPGS